MYWNAGTQHAKTRMIRVATATTTSTALNEDAIQSTHSFQYQLPFPVSRLQTPPSKPAIQKWFAKSSVKRKNCWV